MADDDAFEDDQALKLLVRVLRNNHSKVRYLTGSRLRRGQLARLNRLILSNRAKEACNSGKRREHCNSQEIHDCYGVSRSSAAVDAPR